MDSEYLPFTNWKQALGLFVVVLIFGAIIVRVPMVRKVWSH